MIKKILQLVVVLLFAVQGVMAQSVEIEHVVTAPGEIAVQVDMLGFMGSNGDVAAITFFIDFDADLMDFTSIDDTQLPGFWLANYNNLTERLIITFNPSAAGAGYDINGKAFDILFDYKGGFGTDIVFDEPFCEISNSSLGNIAATYVGGSVTQTPAVGTASMGALVETVGTTVSMPVDMAGAAFDSVASLTFEIAFDDFRLSYAGLVDDALTGVVASSSDGMLTLTWDGSGSTVDLTSHHLFDIQFVFHGGDADVVFVPGCEVNDVDLSPHAMDYVDGVITDAGGTASFTIANIGANTDTVPVPVSVPIDAATFGTEVLGAITFNVSYDATKLTYTGFTKQQLPTGWVANSGTSGLVTFEWSSLTGSTLADGALITLNFDYDTAGGTADIMFTAGSIVKDVNLVTIPVSFFDGSIASNSVDGMVTYFGGVFPIGTAGTSATTVYLKNVADSSVAYSSGTDAMGAYTFSGVANGNYFVDAMTTIDATLGYDITDAFIVFGIGPSLVGMQALAADVNMDGVDVTDAFIIYGSVLAGNVKGPAWTAPDWFFETPSLAVSGDVTQNIKAICSGDANGDFVPVP